MNKKTISFILLVVILCSLNSPIAAFRKETDIVRQNSKTEIVNSNLKITQNLEQELNNIASVLLKYSEESGSQSLKWKKILNAPNDSPYIADQYYPGLYSGVAGIGLFFLNLYQYSHNTTYLTTAEKSANYILTQRKIVNSTEYWQRSEYSLSDSYSSQKYGSAGIVEFLISLYKTTQISLYLNSAIEAMNSLINYYLNDTSVGKTWGYSFFGEIPLTGLMYGVSGITTSFLDLFELTNNNTFLTEAIKGLNWVLSLSRVESSTFGNQRSLSYSPTLTYPYNYTGYSTGESGIGDLFLKTYSITGDNQYLTYAKEIGNWLLGNEHNGQWLYGGVDYMTGSTNKDGYFLGLSSGSAGIAMFLMNLYKMSQDKEYLNSVNRIHSMLLDKMKTDGTKKFFTVQSLGLFANSVQTGLKHGVAGIGVFFNKFYRLFENNTDLSIISGISDYLHSVETPEGLIPIEINSTNTFFDSSLFEGLSGIGLFYLDAILSSNENISSRTTAFQSGFLLESYDFILNPVQENNFSTGYDYLTIIVVIILLINIRKLRPK